MHAYRSWPRVVLLAAVVVALPGGLCLGQQQAGAIQTGTQAAAAADGVTIFPQDTREVLVNPSMGWVVYFYSNLTSNYGSKLAPADTMDDFPGVSTVYLRVPWAFLEPQEGKFNWSLLDTPAQRWIAKGKQIALRITCSENWLPYATPEWVKQAGAKGVFYQFGKGPADDGKLWDPDYLDPVFLQKLDAFLAALAARYDGNPNVAYIDIGSFGLWGEGHTLMSSQLPDSIVPDIVERHIALHRKHFRHAVLSISDDVVGHDRPMSRSPITDHALAQGVSLRDDSIMVQPPPRSWYHAELFQAFWPRLPVVLEHEHFGSSKQRAAWGDGTLLLKAVEDHHACYLSIHWWPREFLQQNREIIDRINMRLGYRLQPRRLTWPKEAIIGKPFNVSSEWINTGVSPCYSGGHMALTLKDEQGGIVSVLVDPSLNMRELAVGPPGEPPVTTLESTFTAGHIAPVIPPGEYQVYVSVGMQDGTPRIAMPLDGDDGKRRYAVGRMTLKAQP